MIEGGETNAMTTSHPSPLTAAQEIAQLKARIADLESSAAAHQCTTAEQLLAAAALGMTSSTGREFFDKLTTHLALTLKMDYVVVGVLLPGRDRVATLSMHGPEGLEKMVEYDLGGTPCENVVSQDVCVYPANVTRYFPTDQMLVDMGIESYLGIPLRGSKQEVLGLLAVLSRKTLGDISMVRQVLEIFSSRAAAEVERLKVEQQLCSERSHLLMAMQAGRVATYEWDLQTQQLTWSEGVNEIFDIEGDLSLASLMQMGSNIHTEDLPRLKQYVSELRAGVLIGGLEFRLRQSGEYRWLRLQGRIAYDEQQRPRRIVGTMSDVTLDHQVQQQQFTFRQRVQRLIETQQLILDGMPIGCLMNDADMRITYANPAVETIFGYSSEELVGELPFGKLVPERSRDGVLQVLAQLRSGVRNTLGIDEHLTKEGRTVFCEWRHTPLFSLSGDFVGYLSMVLDVTERVRRDEQIRRNEQLLRRQLDELEGIYAAAPVGLAFFDRHGRLVRMNDLLSQAFGSRADRLIGRSLEEILGESAGPMVTPLERVITTGQSVSDVCVVTRSGLGAKEQRHWLVDYCPVLGIAGEVVGVTAVVEEVTSRVLAERERENLIRQLEMKNAELERFAYTVSHDLKSPLITISGFAGVLEQDLDMGQMQAARDDLREIKDAATHMSLLLDELLQLSRVGRFVGELRPIVLGNVVRRVLSAAAGRLGAKYVEFVVDPHLPTVMGDEVRLYELFQNLVDNAIKFSGMTAVPRITFSCRSLAPTIVMEVRDNGIGVQPRYLEKIFGLFEQLSPEVEGTGVGLAIAKRVMEVHGGKIWAESEGLGKGTAIVMEFPACDSSSDS